MLFTKNSYFTLGGKRYKRLSHIFHDSRLPDKQHDNLIDFVQVETQTEMNESIEVEIVPVTIASQVNRELTDIEKIHDEYVLICGVKAYPRLMMEKMVEEKKIIIE